MVGAVGCLTGAEMGGRWPSSFKDCLLSIYYVLGRNFDVLSFSPLKTILQMQKLSQVMVVRHLPKLVHA